jgi:hypothetical protein
MEEKLLNTLKFGLAMPTVYDFLKIFQVCIVCQFALPVQSHHVHIAVPLASLPFPSLSFPFLSHLQRVQLI